MHRIRPVLALAAMAVLLGCASSDRYGWTSRPPEDPGKTWTGLTPVPPVEQPAVQATPAQFPPPGTTLALDEVLDITLQNNPRTRAAWAQARAAWADAGSKASGYYPKVDLGAGLARARETASGGQVKLIQTTYGPSVTLSYLLYDFGKRGADVEASRAAYLAASYTHNAVLADVAFEVEQAFYAYVRARALREASRSSVQDAEENLRAAEERHKAGLATIADVLQARTARSQALLILQIIEGQVMTLRGTLATQMGIPATAPYEVDMPAFGATAPPQTLETVDALVQEALAGRPDLEAARARVLEARSQADSARAERWPALSLNANAYRTYYGDPSGPPFNTNWSGSIGFTVPLFAGFDRKYQILKAEAEAEAAAFQAKTLADQVVLSVWTAYYDVQTALQQMSTSADLLDSADESEKVALERYKAGVGTILDLLAAQSALGSARALRVQAQTDWYLSMAGLAYSTGRLQAPEAASTPQTAGENPHDASR